MRVVNRPCCDRRGGHDRGGGLASRGRRRLDRGRVEEVRRRARVPKAGLRGWNVKGNIAQGVGPQTAASRLVSSLLLLPLLLLDLAGLRIAMLPHSKGPLLNAVIVFAIQVVIVEVGCSRIIVAGRRTTRERLPRFVAIAGARRVERPHFVHAEGRVFARIAARPLARFVRALE